MNIITDLHFRYDVINTLISHRNYSSFLEIGTDQGETFRNVIAERKVSVDPNPLTHPTFQLTSDEYFAQCSDSFDLIFIDGLHEHNQAYRDIVNSIKHLNQNGAIVLHDCLPTTERMQEYHTSSQSFEWTGDVWKAFVNARTILPYFMYTVNVDYGCCIIDTIRYSPHLFPLPVDMETMTYQQFVNHRDEWMNVKDGVIIG